MRDVEDVQFAACGRFGGGFAGWVVGDVVAVDDVLCLFISMCVSMVSRFQRT